MLRQLWQCLCHAHLSESTSHMYMLVILLVPENARMRTVVTPNLPHSIMAPAAHHEIWKFCQSTSKLRY